MGLVGAGYAGLAGEDNTTRSDDGAIVAEGEIGAFRIRRGDCVGELSGDLVESTTGVPCSEPHANEVYHAFNMVGSDGQWPGTDATEQVAFDGCFDAFEPFVGEPYDTSIYGFTYLYPTEQSWESVDDREVLCLVNHYDGTLKTGSARNTAR